MEERSDTERVPDEVMLPGFRFHPTDEELVGFYLKRKIQQRPLSIELIRQLDIYKYDPWDLPKLANTGEKEWYFYCPRDRKYRNSSRPNRVTGAGFWKATGTDRPVYSSDGTKCIGLKKSLVFYKGRAAKGVKTDWMMLEFRLPSLAEHAVPEKRSEKSFPANDSWAICRIFKKANSIAQRALSHSWVSPFFPEPNASHGHQFSSETIDDKSLTSTTKTTSSSPNSAAFSPVDFASYRLYGQNPIVTNLSTLEFCPNTTLLDTITPSVLPNMSSILGDSHFGSKCTDLISQTTSHEELQYSGNDCLANTLPYQDHLVYGTGLGFDDRNSMIKNLIVNNGTISDDQSSDSDQWEVVRSSLGFPFTAGLPLSTSVADPWKPSLLWDTLPFPTEVPTSFPATRRYTWQFK